MFKLALSCAALLTLASADLSQAQAGGKIAFETTRDGLPQIYMMDTDGTNLVRVTNPELWNHTPHFSPGGDKIAYSSSPSRWMADREIYVINTDGTNAVNLSNMPGATDQNPVWSPDGTKIAFWSDRDGNAEIYVMDADGSNQVNLTNNSEFHEEMPQWSPDGSRLLYVSRPLDSNFRLLFTMDADGSNPVQLLESSMNSVSQDHAAWSPDGTQIVFDGWRGDFDLYAVDADGSDVRKLTSISREDEAAPQWSPDGSQIVYLATDKSSGSRLPDIWVMNADGSEPRNLTQHSATDIWPTWSGGATVAPPTAIEAISWGRLKGDWR